MTTWSAIPVVVLLGSTVIAQSAPTRPTYASADVDQDGNLRIVRSDRHTLTVPRSGESKTSGKQTSFEKVAISSDHTAVGALEDYPNCCTSYDVPLRLLVFVNGRTHRFVGIGLAIFEWHFVDGGRRVAFGETTVHGTCEKYWQLWEIEPERRLAQATDATGCLD